MNSTKQPPLPCRQLSNQKIPSWKRILRHLILEAAVSVLTAFLIEFCLNYQALRGGCSPVDISASGALQEDGSLVYSYTPDSPVYIKNLILQGSFPKRLTYTVQATVINEFGAEENLELTDKVNPEFDCAFTGIRATVSHLELEFSETEGLDITSLSYSNEFSINNYRLALFTLIVFLALLILFEKTWLSGMPEVLFAIFALGFGCLILSVTGPCSVTWDEEAHFSSACTTDLSSSAAFSQAEELNFVRNNFSINTEEELILLKRYMNQMDETAGETGYGTQFSLRTFLAYFPMILFYHLGKLLRLSFSARFALGKLGNLLFCTLAGIFCIRIARRKKYLIAVVLSMPTVLFQFGTYSYDGVIIACLSLGMVLSMNELEDLDQGESPKIRNVLLILALFGVACMTKPVYAPVFLLIPFLLPLRKIRGSIPRRQKFLLAACFALLGAVCLFLAVRFLYPILHNLMIGNTAYGGDLRGGETSATGQLLSIIRHPVAFLKMLIHEIFTMDHFRSYKTTAADQVSPLNLLFVNLYILGKLKDAWSLILAPLLLLLFFTEPKGEPDFPVSIRKIRLVCAAILLSSVLLIWLAMYLVFTPVGSSEISGVQTRYFLPLFLPLAYAVCSRRVKVDISRVHYFQIVWGATLLLSGVCFYQTLIAGRVW